MPPSSRARRTPRVRVGLRRPGRDGAAHRVQDNGVGFDAVARGALFKPFSRLHARDDYPGTGIGLTIVQRIVERHGGRVRPRPTSGVALASSSRCPAAAQNCGFVRRTAKRSANFGGGRPPRPCRRSPRAARADRAAGRQVHRVKSSPMNPAPPSACSRPEAGRGTFARQVGSIRMRRVAQQRVVARPPLAPSMRDTLISGSQLRLPSTRPGLQLGTQPRRCPRWPGRNAC